MLGSPGKFNSPPVPVVRTGTGRSFAPFIPPVPKLNSKIAAGVLHVKAIARRIICIFIGFFS
jgi:hypothetical protein